jgi:DNA end-binding protein Ku
MTLIERFTSSFDHAKYEDEYRARLLEIVKRKQRGDEVHAPPDEERAAPSDLLDALRASVESAKGGSNGHPERGTKRSRKRRTRAKS